MTNNSRIFSNSKQGYLFAVSFFAALPCSNAFHQVMIPSASRRLSHTNGRIGQFGLNPVAQSSALFYHDREMDIMEEFVGGRRYEMVELPDSLVETTLFVGNLCEFVTDEMLSAIFQQASSLNFIPAVVCRKPNSSSLKYGFVTFPTVDEKEVCIFSWNIPFVILTSVILEYSDT